MSVFRWRYDETCEGRYCCGDCDKCDKEDEPVDDLISRQAAIDAVIKHLQLDYEYAWGVREAINGLPTAEKQGKWKEEQDDDWAGGGAWVCSDCGWGYSFGGYHEANEFKHCPNCGARMEE